MKKLAVPLKYALDICKVAPLDSVFSNSLIASPPHFACATPQPAGLERYGSSTKLGAKAR